MRLKVIATGSKGNCYLLYNENESLIIECGVKVSELKKALNFDLSNVVGALVTHSHGDHAKYVNEFISSGISVYLSSKTKEEVSIKSHRLKNIEANKLLKVGGFKVLPFELNHDVACLGFVINHFETGNILFLTDTYYSAYKFKNLNQIIIEANYSEEILEKKYNNGTTLPFLRDRILESHLSLENCQDIFRVNDLTSVNNIVLIHLSDSNSNEVVFKDRVEKQTGKAVTVAKNGTDINFNKTPF
jgi:phosphoribosyl 1,2-cyclic phosphodiesterase